MELLSSFSPRLVGPVLHGTAGLHAAIDLHVFSDSVEHVADQLERHQVICKLYEKRLKSRRGCAETYAGFQFLHAESSIEATVFPFDGIRQAPISPVDGKPMRRADTRAVLALLED